MKTYLVFSEGGDNIEKSDLIAGKINDEGRVENISDTQHQFNNVDFVDDSLYVPTNEKYESFFYSTLARLKRAIYPQGQ